jgi:hypothetical protein
MKCLFDAYLPPVVEADNGSGSKQMDNVKSFLTFCILRIDYESLRYIFPLRRQFKKL